MKLGSGECEVKSGGGDLRGFSRAKGLMELTQIKGKRPGAFIENVMSGATIVAIGLETLSGLRSAKHAHLRGRNSERRIVPSGFVLRRVCGRLKEGI